MSHGAFPPPTRRAPLMIERDVSATLSLVCGVLGLVAWLLPVLGFIVGVAAVVFGLRAQRSTRRGLANVGVALGVVALVLAAANSAFTLWLVSTGAFNPFA